MTKHNSLTRLQLFLALPVYLLLQGMNSRKIDDNFFSFISFEGSKIENLFRIPRKGAWRGFDTVVITENVKQ